MFLVGRLITCKVLYTANAVRSLLTDYGVESQAWFTPTPISASGTNAASSDESSSVGFLFKLSMPLPDADHSLHHVSWHDGWQIGQDVSW